MGTEGLVITRLEVEPRLRGGRNILLLLLLSLLLHLVLALLLTTTLRHWWRPPPPPPVRWIEVVEPPPAKAPPKRTLPIVETPKIKESPPPKRPEARAERTLRKQGTNKEAAAPEAGTIRQIPMAPPPPSKATPPAKAAAPPQPRPQPPEKSVAAQPPVTPRVREGDLLPAPTLETPSKAGPRPEEVMPPPAPPRAPATPPRRGVELVPSWTNPVYQPYMQPRPGARAEAPDLGHRVIPLETQDDRFISYFLKIKRQIEYIWDYPRDAAMRGESGGCVIQFTILKNGLLAGRPKLLRSSGFTALDREALGAVADGAPYPPIPKRLKTDSLTVTGNFLYILHRNPFVR